MSNNFILSTIKEEHLYSDNGKDSLVYKNIISQEEIDVLGAALTFEGLELTYDNINAMFNWIESLTPIYTKRFYLIKGSVLNRICGLYDEDAYNNDLNIICVDLNDLENANKLIIPRFSVGGRWLNDVIANNIDCASFSDN